MKHKKEKKLTIISHIEDYLEGDLNEAMAWFKEIKEKNSEYHRFEITCEFDGERDVLCLVGARWESEEETKERQKQILEDSKSFERYTQKCIHDLKKLGYTVSKVKK